MNLSKRLKEDPYGVSSFVYLVFPIIALFSDQIEGPKWFLILMIIIFSVDYYLMIFHVNVQTSKIKRLIYLMIHLVGIVYFCYAIGSTFVMFFFFGSFALPYVYRVAAKSLENYLYLITIVMTSVYLIAQSTQIAIIVVVIDLIVIIIAFTNFQNVENNKAKEKIEEKNRYINLLIAEQERQRIGQDLHDTLGHVFASLSIKSELAAKLIDIDIDKAKTEMQSVNQLSKEALEKVREIVDQLKFQSFQEEVASVSHLLQETGIQFNFENAKVAKSINKGRQSILSMILREAVNNIVKHSEATRVSGCLVETDTGYLFKIQDNGKGMEPSATALNSIEERVKLLGGNLKIISNQGLTIEIEFKRGEL